LTNPKHRVKVRANADQLGLTGVTIYNPKFALVIVEGGAKGIKKYKHLMLHRMDWTEEPTNAVAVREPSADVVGPNDPDPATTSTGPAPSLAENRCDLVWEGEQRERYFRDFRPKSTPTDQLAKDFLGPKLEGLWDVARKATDEIMGV
jgi:U4/U6 small nuclear ribonucleoprotein PRP3